MTCQCFLQFCVPSFYSLFKLKVFQFTFCVDECVVIYVHHMYAWCPAMVVSYDVGTGKEPQVLCKNR